MSGNNKNTTDENSIYSETLYGIRVYDKSIDDFGFVRKISLNGSLTTIEFSPSLFESVSFKSESACEFACSMIKDMFPDMGHAQVVKFYVNALKQV